MKAYTVNITDEVAADIENAFDYIHEQSPQNAVKWLRELYKAIDTLEKMPDRCPLIREHDAFEEQVRNLLFYSHRIIFTINEGTETVQVHAFRHAAQDEIRPD